MKLKCFYSGIAEPSQFKTFKFQVNVNVNVNVNVFLEFFEKIEMLIDVNVVIFFWYSGAESRLSGFTFQVSESESE